jgi:hypothetical protein
MAVVKFSRFTVDHIRSKMVESLRMSFDFLLFNREPEEISFRMNAAEDLGCVIPHRVSCVLNPERRSEFLKQACAELDSVFRTWLRMTEK